MAPRKTIESGEPASYRSLLRVTAYCLPYCSTSYINSEGEGKGDDFDDAISMLQLMVTLLRLTQLLCLIDSCYGLWSCSGLQPTA